MLSFVAGQMLSANLWRGTANLAFQSDLVYLDVVNDRVGVNTTTPTVAFEVNGNAVIGNITTNSVSSTTALAINTAANGNVVITPNGVGITKIIGTNGLVIPFGNTVQRPGTPDVGTLRLNTGLDQLEIWDGSSWLTGSGGGGGNVNVTDQQITPDGSSLTYSLNQSAGTAEILVTLNGVIQYPTISYTANALANTITFTQAPAQTDLIDVRFLAAVTPGGEIYNTSGNASIHVLDDSNIIFTTNNVDVAAITSTGVLDISTGRSLKLRTYTVAQAANIASPSTGEVVYVSNGDSGNPCLAAYSGGAWKRISLGANIST